MSAVPTCNCGRTHLQCMRTFTGCRYFDLGRFFRDKRPMPNTGGQQRATQRRKAV